MYLKSCGFLGFGKTSVEMSHICGPGTVPSGDKCVVSEHVCGVGKTLDANDHVCKAVACAPENTLFSGYCHHGVGTIPGGVLLDRPDQASLCTTGHANPNRRCTSGLFGERVSAAEQCVSGMATSGTGPPGSGADGKFCHDGDGSLPNGTPVTVDEQHLCETGLVHGNRCFQKKGIGSHAGSPEDCMSGMVTNGGRKIPRVCHGGEGSLPNGAPVGDFEEKFCESGFARFHKCADAA